MHPRERPTSTVRGVEGYLPLADRLWILPSAAARVGGGRGSFRRSRVAHAVLDPVETIPAVRQASWRLRHRVAALVSDSRPLVLSVMGSHEIPEEMIAPEARQGWVPILHTLTHALAREGIIRAQVAEIVKNPESTTDAGDGDTWMIAGDYRVLVGRGGIVMRFGSSRLRPMPGPDEVGGHA